LRCELHALIEAEATAVTASSPHMTYLFGAFGVMMQVTSDNLAMFWFGTLFENSIWKKPTLIERFNTMYMNVITYFISEKSPRTSSGRP
jgi:hypothetical protein